MAPVPWTVWSDLWNITSLPFTRAARVQLPRSPITQSLAKHSTAPGECQRRQCLKEAFRKKAPVHQTATTWDSLLSRYPTTHLSRASMLNARRGRCVWTHTCGPKASSWACQLVFPWLERVRQFTRCIVKLCLFEYSQSYLVIPIMKCETVLLYW